MSPPIHFAVVAAVNRGKSSIVSTLAENDSIRISPSPGTTREARSYPVVVDDETLFVLTDTPGFERARELLAWIERERGPEGSPGSVLERFVREHRDDSGFRAECELLAPILGGAAVLYVVDGAVPFRDHMRAEMEILRWAAPLRVALINRRGEHLEGWKGELRAHFQMVREFDAQRVGFGERIGLLRGLREVNEGHWREGLQRIVEALELDWKRRRRRSARIIADLVAKSIVHGLRVPIPSGDDPEDHQARLTKRFHDDLRKLEEKARVEIEALYKHARLEHAEAADRPVWEEDLFDPARWEPLGLAPRQLLALGATLGAVTGGAVDVAVGGASFMLGAVLGAAMGAGGALWRSGQPIASVEGLRGLVRGDRLLRIGPHPNPNFPFVLLDANLLHWTAIRERAHAERSTLVLERAGEKEGPSSALGAGERKALSKCFAGVRKRAPRVDPSARDLLAEKVEGLMGRLE
ncbi:MAG: GTP-binding protein [Gemmatimonadetes bacterium]|nr:GTP-binding protein [Gemmatimonadota bacterium]